MVGLRQRNRPGGHRDKLEEWNMQTETAAEKSNVLEFAGEYMGQDHYEAPGLVGYWNATMGYVVAYMAGHQGPTGRVLTAADVAALTAAAKAQGLALNG
jgi:hypothetical protein